jgi:uncharacterized membrane protein YjjB (DUF3815 family)
MCFHTHSSGFSSGAYPGRKNKRNRPLVDAAKAMVLAQGLTSLSADLSRLPRTLLGSVVIGVIGTLLAHRSAAPTAIWTAPPILPLLPAPATLLPLLAETEAAQQALQGQAVQTAFAIGVGVASGSIIVATYQRYRERVLEPAAGVVSEGVSTYVVRPAMRRVRSWWRRTDGQAKRSQ